MDIFLTAQMILAPLAEAVVLSLAAIDAIFRGPTRENDTVNEVRLRIERDERRAAEDQESKQREKELEEGRKRLQAMKKREREETSLESARIEGGRKRARGNTTAREEEEKPQKEE